MLASNISVWWLRSRFPRMTIQNWPVFGEVVRLRPAKAKGGPSAALLGVLIKPRLPVR